MTIHHWTNTMKKLFLASLFLSSACFALPANTRIYSEDTDRLSSQNVGFISQEIPSVDGGVPYNSDGQFSQDSTHSQYPNDDQYPNLPPNYPEMNEAKSKEENRVYPGQNIELTNKNSNPYQPDPNGNPLTDTMDLGNPSSVDYHAEGPEYAPHTEENKYLSLNNDPYGTETAVDGDNGPGASTGSYVGDAEDLSSEESRVDEQVTAPNDELVEHDGNTEYMHNTDDQNMYEVDEGQPETPLPQQMNAEWSSPDLSHDNSDATVNPTTFDEAAEATHNNSIANNNPDGQEDDNKEVQTATPDASTSETEIDLTNEKISLHEVNTGENTWQKDVITKLPSTNDLYTEESHSAVDNSDTTPNTDGGFGLQKENSDMLLGENHASTIVDMNIPYDDSQTSNPEVSNEAGITTSKPDSENPGSRFNEEALETIPDLNKGVDVTFDQTVLSNNGVGEVETQSPYTHFVGLNTEMTGHDNDRENEHLIEGFTQEGDTADDLDSDDKENRLKLVDETDRFYVESITDSPMKDEATDSYQHDLIEATHSDHLPSEVAEHEEEPTELEENYRTQAPYLTQDEEEETAIGGATEEPEETYTESDATSTSYLSRVDEDHDLDETEFPTEETDQYEEQVTTESARYGLAFNGEESHEATEASYVEEYTEMEENYPEETTMFEDVVESATYIDESEEENTVRDSEMWEVSMDDEIRTLLEKEHFDDEEPEHRRPILPIILLLLVVIATLMLCTKLPSYCYSTVIAFRQIEATQFLLPRRWGKKGYTILPMGDKSV